MDIELPRITVSMEKTKQVVQWEPVKISVFLSESVEAITLEKIQELIHIAETEIDTKLNSMVRRR